MNDTTAVQTTSEVALRGLSPEAEDLALSNTPVQFLADAYAKVSPEGQLKFRERLGPILENLTKAIAMYIGAEAIYQGIMFPPVVDEAAAA